MEPSLGEPRMIQKPLTYGKGVFATYHECYQNQVSPHNVSIFSSGLVLGNYNLYLINF